MGTPTAAVRGDVPELLWTSFACFDSPHIVPIAAFQLAPLTWLDVEADVPADAMIAGFGRPWLRVGIRNAARKTSDEQPGQDSKLHQAPSFAASAAFEKEFGRPSVGGQWNESGYAMEPKFYPDEENQVSGSSGELRSPFKTDHISPLFSINSVTDSSRANSLTAVIVPCSRTAL